MRILKIKIKNLNCIRCEWEIDFQSSPLYEAGLFAITGPTGAGKSTILDAITLALFNKIPRFDSTAISETFIEKAGSIITKNEIDCAVEVDYSCRKGVYRSKWSIAKNKKGGLRKYEMEITNPLTNEILVSGRKEVPNKNIEFIGLTYDQFIKSILLSQGEFSKFLKSNKDERGKLLEEITGMRIYRELGKRAFEISNEKNKAIKSKVDVIEAEESLIFSEAIEKELENKIYAADKEIKDNEEAKEEKSKAIQVKNNIAAIEREIYQHDLNKIEANDKLHAFRKTYSERINKHEQLLPYLTEIKSYINTIDELRKVEPEVEKENKALVYQNQSLELCINLINLLIKDEANKSNAITLLNNFRQKITSLITEKSNAHASMQMQQNRVFMLTKKEGLVRYKNIISKKNEEIEAEIRKDLLKIESEIDQYSEQYKIKPDKIKEAAQRFTEKRNRLVELKSWVETFSDNRTKISVIEKQIENSDSLIKEHSPAISTLNNDLELLLDKIEYVRNEILKKVQEQDLDEMRNSLKNGEPCPLCGSTHHPYIHEYIDNLHLLKKDLNELQEEKVKKENDRDKLLKISNTNQGIIDSNNTLKKVVEKEQQELIKKIEALRKQLAIEKVGNKQNVELMILQTDAEKQAVDNLQNLLTDKDNLEDFKNEFNELIGRTRLYEQAKFEVEKLYKGVDINKDSDKLSKQLSDIILASKNSEGNIKLYNKQIDALKSTCNQLESSLTKNLSALSYTSITDAGKDILEHTQFNALKHQLTDFEGSINTISGLVENAAKRKETETAKDDISKTLGQLNEELLIILQSLKENKNHLLEKTAQKTENDNRKNRILELKEQIKTVRANNLKWELLCKYIGDANGKNFSTFAQGLTLRKLIILANVRLKKLNDRYLLDVPKAEEDDDLTIIDTYLGEERRSVKTLSGGETFIVSLALALALSDLASRHIKIESLFIDEGFGTLDPESLDLAISTLEQLQTESNKTIGIISHVDSLKERIGTQIQLQKGSNGFSDIKITTV